MSTQPEALRLAEWLDHHGEKSSHADASAELRRLHELNQDLLEALEFVIRGVPDTWEGVQKASAAIAKARVEK
jgi:hypothetical protein